MQIIDQHREEIEALCRKHSVQKLYAFGSVLSEKFSDLSDVDLLVEFRGVDLSRYADNYFELKFALEETFNHPVDLIEAKALRNPFFQQSVEASRQLLYAA
ncbi:MAG: nucleotidyltransferase [Chitinophagaceae bacterium]|nr:MAG: nucleotidyltransferase [Chitinophagaceae bacterium]